MKRWERAALSSKGLLGHRFWVVKLRTSSVFQDGKLLPDSLGYIHRRANVRGCRLPVLSTPPESKPWEGGYLRSLS